MDVITGQVSVLVPVVVGVIGVIGVVAGQLVNAWREDRRWTREKEREDTRWQRETTREAAKLDRETKIAVYGRLVTTLRRAERILDQLRDLSGKHDTGALTVEYIEAVDAILAEAAEIELICSGEMLARFYDVLLEIRMLPAAMYGLDTEDPRTKLRVVASSPREVLPKIAEYRKLFLELARKELRLDTSD